jgi:hypothetical protein
MALGLHWEWRGFGTVSGHFSRRFRKLGSTFTPPDVEDVYLWARGLTVNIKMRDIPEEPFKLKRLRNKDGDLEQWAEDPEEIFRFPLNQAGWKRLADTLAAADVALGRCPPGGADARTTLARLRAAGVRTVTVKKQRESGLWQGPHGRVKVERATVSAPQAITSIGLETWDEDSEAPRLPDRQAKEDIRAAIAALGLKDEALRVMNYLDAVAIWACGEEIVPMCW